MAVERNGGLLYYLVEKESIENTRRAVILSFVEGYGVKASHTIVRRAQYDTLH